MRRIVLRRIPLYFGKTTCLTKLPYQYLLNLSILLIIYFSHHLKVSCKISAQILRFFLSLSLVSFFSYILFYLRSDRRLLLLSIPVNHEKLEIGQPFCLSHCSNEELLAPVSQSKATITPLLPFPLDDFLLFYKLLQLNIQPNLHFLQYEIH